MAIRALVIDDDAAIRDAAEISLRIVGGWDVTTAGSGSEGIEILDGAERDFDLILLDQMMPGLTGMETFENLRAQDSTRDIPVVFMTAKVQPLDRERFAAIGIRHVVAKPFDPMTLASTLQQLLDDHADA